MAHVFERPSLRESTVLTTPGGAQYRWADDEPNPANVPSDATWSDTMPGGFENFETTLARDPNLDYSDVERLTNVTHHDAAGGIIWDGRLERAPRTSGDQIAITPSAVGWQAHLDDDNTVQFLARDVDMSKFRGMSATRRAAVLAVNVATTDPDIDADASTGAPALRMSLQGPWASGIACEAWYDAGAGSDVAKVAWSRTSSSDQASQPSASFSFATIASATDGAADQMGSDLHVSIADGETNTSYTPTTPARFVAFQWAFFAANATAGEYLSSLTDVAVYGNHGLTLRGTEPTAGFYDADLIRYALTRWCPLLNYTSESLTADPFIIPQFAFTDPTTVSELVRQATRFKLRDWAVWDNRTFWLHDRGARGTKWKARASEAQLEETGPQVDRLWNGVIVAYQDVDGSTRTVGPVGSGADTETDDVVDPDPENPANKLGIRRWDMLTMGVTSSDGATIVGQEFLEQAKLLDSSGRARVIGHVQDSNGVWHPYSHMRAGDQISFPDAADTSYRRLVRTEKSRADRSCAFDIDAPPDGLQALLERLGVELVRLGL